MIDEIWNNRQVSGYSDKSANKKDFMRSWDHSRTAKHLSIEDLMENGTTINGETLHEIADPSKNFEAHVLLDIHMNEFKQKLSEQDAKILQMRYDGYSLKEIAEAVGFKTAGAVHKHIAKIADSYEDFVDDACSGFLDKHIKEWKHNMASEAVAKKRGCFFVPRKEFRMTNEPLENLPDVLNAKQLAEMLHLSKAWAYNLLNSDDFPTLKIGGKKLVMKQDLLSW